MAKRGKIVGGVQYVPKYKEEFKELLKGKTIDVKQVVDKKCGNSPGTFLGFRLKKENISRLWRWDTLEDIS